METIVNDIETYFAANWTYCDLHFDDTEYNTTIGDDWLDVLIIPQYSENDSMDGTQTDCLRYSGMLSTTCYAANKVAALKILTNLQVFLQNQTIGVSEVKFNGFYNVANGPQEDGQYLYKIMWSFKQ